MHSLLCYSKAKGYKQSSLQLSVSWNVSLFLQLLWLTYAVFIAEKHSGDTYGTLITLNI